MRAIFIALLVFAVAAFLAIVGLAVFVFLSSGAGSRALLSAGIALSAVYLVLSVSFLILGSRRKKS